MAEYKLTSRENYRRVLEGKMPEWVPVTNLDVCTIKPRQVFSFVFEKDMTDMFGTKWILSPTDAGLAVDPKTPRLEDITQWEKWVTFPDLDAMPWESMAQKDLESVDPSKGTMLMSNAIGELFIPLMDMLGFAEGLIAIAEEPETIMDFNEAVTEWRIRQIKKLLEYYHPDSFMIADDFCSEQGMMISPNTFRSMYLPFYKRMIDTIKEYDVPVEFHLCGKAAGGIEDLVDAGVDVWQSAQWINDIPSYQKKYGKRLKYNGVWDTRGEGSMEGDSEEITRRGVRTCMDACAENGTLIFWPGRNLGVSEDAQTRFKWLLDEAYRYGHEIYKK